MSQIADVKDSVSADAMLQNLSTYLSSQQLTNTKSIMASAVSTNYSYRGSKSHTYSTDALSPLDDIAAINEQVSSVDEQITLMLTKRASLIRRVNNIQSSIFSIPADVIAVLNEELSRIDDQIALMSTKKASLLQYVNNIQSPICSIPTEVLSRILEMVVVDGRNTESPSPYIPLLLGSVSSYWRNVIHSSPRIWTSIRIGHDNFSTAFRDEKITLLRYYLERARALPLSFILESSDPTTKSEENITSAMDFLLQEHPMRIAALHLKDVPIQSFATFSGENQLKALTISYGYEYPYAESVFTLPSLPALRRLKLNHTPTIEFTTTSITCLHLQSMSYDHYMRLLLLCRATLVEFRARVTAPATRDWAENNQNLIHTLPEVKTFEWEFASPYVDYDPFVLSYLHMPQLHDLKLLNFSPYQRINISSSPQVSAVNVCLYIAQDAYYPNDSSDYGYHEYEENGIEDLIHILDTQRLIVGQFMWHGIDDIIDALNPSSTEGAIYVPGLKYLSFPWTVDIGSFDLQIIPEPTFELLVLMLEKRLKLCVDEDSVSANNEPFILEMPYNRNKSEMKWRECEGRKQALVDAGLLRVDACHPHLNLRAHTSFIEDD